MHVKLDFGVKDLEDVEAEVSKWHLGLSAPRSLVRFIEEHGRVYLYAECRYRHELVRIAEKFFSSRTLAEETVAEQNEITED